MEANVGQIVRVGDVWYSVMNKRFGVNEMTCNLGNEYLLYSKDYWIPEAWINDTQD